MQDHSKRHARMARNGKAIYSAEYANQARTLYDITQIKMIAEMRVAESNSAYDNLENSSISGR